MITIHNKRFAENEKEFVGSLFDDDDGTCVGYAKRTKRTVKLFDHQNTLVGIINKYGVLCKCSKTDDGKTWYSYGDIHIVGNVDPYLLDKHHIHTERRWNGKEYEYYFK